MNRTSTCASIPRIQLRWCSSPCALYLSASPRSGREAPRSGREPRPAGARRPARRGDTCPEPHTCTCGAPPGGGRGGGGGGPPPPPPSRSTPLGLRLSRFPTHLRESGEGDEGRRRQILVTRVMGATAGGGARGGAIGDAPAAQKRPSRSIRD